ncbi:MAG TPA: M20/M25/M40 family metallo-hydrolase [Thermoanaerobaculia bacterium]
MPDFELPGDLDAAAFGAAVELLSRLTAESSPSTDPAGLRRFAARLAGELERRGLAARVDEAAGAGGVSLPLLVAESTPGTAPLLLLGHLDTVLAAAAPRREAERLYATGAIDMKGGIATLLAALDRLAARGRPPAAGLRLVLVPDEEVAGEISRRATAEHGATARAVWVLEPGQPAADGTETIVLGRRGMATFRLDVRGRAAHSGLHFWHGRSAVVAAAEWCAAAAALSRPGDGPTVSLARIVGGDASFVENLAEQAALVGSEAQLNVVPARAVVEGEFRFLHAGDREEVAAALAGEARAVAERREVEARLAFAGAVPPVEPTPRRRAAAARVVELARRRGWTLEVEVDRGGISFPNFLPAGTDVPVVDGLGPVGGGMHTRDEHVDLRSYARRIVLLADLLAAEAAGGAGDSA